MGEEGHALSAEFVPWSYGHNSNGARVDLQPVRWYRFRTQLNEYEPEALLIKIT